MRQLLNLAMPYKTLGKIHAYPVSSQSRGYMTDPDATCSECGRPKSPIDRCSPDSIDDDGECPYLTIVRLREEPDRAFVRGFAAAVAQTVRHQVDARDLLRSISATEALLVEAGVEEFDLAELRPTLEKIGSQPDKHGKIKLCAVVGCTYRTRRRYCHRCLTKMNRPVRKSKRP